MLLNRPICDEISLEISILTFSLKAKSGCPDTQNAHVANLFTSLLTPNSNRLMINLGGNNSIQYAREGVFPYMGYIGM